MTEIVKWLGKSTLTAIFWVFILSIHVQGRPLFFIAHEIFIQNAFVQQMDEYLVDLWGKASETASRTYDQLSDEEEETTF